MARTKVSGANSRTLVDKENRPRQLQPALPYDSDWHSPSLTATRKRRRLTRSSSISDHDVKAALDAERSLHELPDEYEVRHEVPSTDAPFCGTSDPSSSSASGHTRVGNHQENSWHSFTVNICACCDDHASYTTLVPLSAVTTFVQLERCVYDLTVRDPSLGVFTDLNGNDLYQFRREFANHMACGLPGIIWHDNFYSDVRLGDRRAAQLYIKTCLSRQKMVFNHTVETDPGIKEVLARPSGNILFQSELKRSTPPAHEIALSSSPSPVPWTAKTTSTGRVTELRSCDQHSSIIRPQTRGHHSENGSNVFEANSEDEGSVYIGTRQIRKSLEELDRERHGV